MFSSIEIYECPMSSGSHVLEVKPTSNAFKFIDVVNWSTSALTMHANCCPWSRYIPWRIQGLFTKIQRRFLDEFKKTDNCKKICQCNNLPSRYDVCHMCRNRLILHVFGYFFRILWGPIHTLRSTQPILTGQKQTSQITLSCHENIAPRGILGCHWSKLSLTSELWPSTCLLRSDWL